MARLVAKVGAAADPTARLAWRSIAPSRPFIGVTIIGSVRQAPSDLLDVQF